MWVKTREASKRKSRTAEEQKSEAEKQKKLKSRAAEKQKQNKQKAMQAKAGGKTGKQNPSGKTST